MIYRVSSAMNQAAAQENNEIGAWILMSKGTGEIHAYCWITPVTATWQCDWSCVMYLPNTWGSIAVTPKRNPTYMHRSMYFCSWFKSYLRPRSRNVNLKTPLKLSKTRSKGFKMTLDVYINHGPYYFCQWACHLGDTGLPQYFHQPLTTCTVWWLCEWPIGSITVENQYSKANNKPVHL
jgi:hypothetical protein